MLNHLDDLSGLGEAGLRDLWERGVAPAAEDLAGWVFRGWNTSSLAARSPVGVRTIAMSAGEPPWGDNWTVKCDDP